MGAGRNVGVLEYAILQVSDLVPTIDADENGRDGRCTGLRRHRGSCGDVGKHFAHVGCVCDVFEECLVGIARARRAGITDDGLEGIAQSFEESGDILVVRFAVLGIIGTDLDGL